MGLLSKVILIVVLGIVSIWCLRKLIFACYEFNDLRHAKRYPENFAQKDGIVFNKKTKELEESSRSILPSEQK